MSNEKLQSLNFGNKSLPSHYSEEKKTMGNKIFILWCLNDKYLSSASFLTSNNGTVYCCSNFRCHIYKYLLNIRTMLEG